jgi:Holliday junction resolvasome RuvABC endonuclease subunit
MKRRKTALSLDISSRSTGVAIFYFDDISSPSFSMDLIIVNEKLTMGERLSLFEKEIRRLLKKIKPDVIVIEEIYRGPNIKTFKTLSQFHGIALKEAWDTCKKMPIYISVNECRSLVSKTLNSKLSLRTKEEIFEALNEAHSLGFLFSKDNDKTDALALGLSYLERLKSEKNSVIKPKKKGS